MKTKVLYNVFYSIFLLFIFLTFNRSLQAQSCDPGVTDCIVDADCRVSDGGFCPDCYSCINDVCVADDTICDAAAGACRQGLCEDPPPDATLLNPLGCGFDVAALEGVQGLDAICYICAPPEVTGVDTCGNGICDVGQGEDCSTCAGDCLIPGFTGDCPLSQDELNEQCQLVDNDCSSGDICQAGACTGISECTVTELSCSGDTSDVCCAAGCQGPPSGLSCTEAEAQGLIPAGACDVDCCPDATCGDNLVESPETCDGTAGIGADGAVVSADACRDPGAAAECTFCGDGITQVAGGEECDGADDAACGEGTCNSSCTCDDICVTGSGNPADTIRTSCGGCSLNSWANSQSWGKDYGLFLALATALVLGLMLRGRSQ